MEDYKKEKKLQEITIEDAQEVLEAPVVLDDEAMKKVAAFNEMLGATTVIDYETLCMNIRACGASG